MHNTDPKQQQNKSFNAMEYIQEGSDPANALSAEAKFTKLVTFSVDLVPVNPVTNIGVDLRDSRIVPEFETVLRISVSPQYCSFLIEHAECPASPRAVPQLAARRFPHRRRQGLNSCPESRFVTSSHRGPRPTSVRRKTPPQPRAPSRGSQLTLSQKRDFDAPPHHAWYRTTVFSDKIIASPATSLPHLPPCAVHYLLPRTQTRRPTHRRPEREPLTGTGAQRAPEEQHRSLRAPGKTDANPSRLLPRQKQPSGLGP